MGSSRVEGSRTGDARRDSERRPPSLAGDQWNLAREPYAEPPAERLVAGDNSTSLTPQLKGVTRDEATRWHTRGRGEYRRREQYLGCHGGHGVSGHGER